MWTFNTYCSFCQGAPTRAKEQGVSKPTIAMNNIWRAVQGKQGICPNLPMTQPPNSNILNHYNYFTDYKMLLINEKLFSWSLALPTLL